MLCCADGSCVHVEYGKPLLPDEFLVNVFLYDPKGKGSFTSLFQIPISQNLRARDLKTFLLKQINEVYGTCLCQITP